MRATDSPSTRGMHHMSLRQGLRPFSARRRRTVSCDRLLCSVSLTIAPASSSRVQRARPSGGLAQAVATSKASSLPVSLRSAPGRCSSLSARSRLPSTKRCLVRLHSGTAHRHGAGNLVTAAAGIGRQHYLGSLELAGGKLAPAQHCGKLVAFGFLPLMKPITCETAYLGGIDIIM